MYALQMLDLWGEQCKFVGAMHCASLFPAFCNALPAIPCIAQAIIVGSAMQVSRWIKTDDLVRIIKEHGNRMSVVDL